MTKKRPRKNFFYTYGEMEALLDLADVLEQAAQQELDRQEDDPDYKMDMDYLKKIKEWRRLIYRLVL
jgi:hypothetical protein